VFRSSPAVADGKVYVGSEDGCVYCLNASTGEKIWSYTTGGNVNSSPAVADGKVYVGSYDYNVYAFGFSYDATIKAHCNAEGADVSVSITMDGSPTGFTTPHTFTNLMQAHTFTVPDYDADGHQFKQWNTSETNTTITVISGGTYTAYYDVMYTLTIRTTTGGTTNPTPDTYNYWPGAVVNVTAIADTYYNFDHWELDGVNIGADNPINVTMNTDHTLHAVFMLHDVAVTNVTPSKTVVGQGDSLNINVTAANQGNYTETFNVTVYTDRFYDPFDVWNYTGAWKYRDPEAAEGYVSVSDGMLHVSGWYAPGYHDGGLTTIKEFNYPITVETKLRANSDYFSPALDFGPNWQLGFICTSYDGNVGGWQTSYFDTTGYYSVVWGGSISVGTWYTLRLVVNETNLKVYLDDVLKVDRDWSPPKEYTKTVDLRTTYGSYGSGDFDWVRIETEIGTQTATLESGTPATTTFTWNTTGFAKGNYTISAYAWPVTGETDTDDNLYVDGNVQIVPISHSLTITSTSGGTTNPAPGSYNYDAGTNVSVTAIANTYYRFDHWELDGVNRTENPINVIMDQDHTLHAVFRALVHDIAVTDVTPSKTVVGQGYSLNINVTVENQGDFTETFNVTVYANATSITTQTVTLTSGNSTTITFTWNTTGFAKGNYSMSAYATPVENETYTADNTLVDGWVFVTIPGDVNGDKRVNILDCILIANHFGHAGGDGHAPGSKEWLDCVNCDINSDTRTNVLDCIVLSNNFGKSWT
jgi:hypothetical protein